MAIEDELVLSADEIAEREVGARVASTRHEHLLTVLGLADVVRRCREVHDQLRSRERQVGRRRARLPDVLADREPDGRLPDPEEDELTALGEVAVLVEDAVVREEVLAVDGLSPVRSAHTAHAFARSRSNHGVPTRAVMPSRLGRDRLERLRVLRGRSRAGGGGPRADIPSSRAPGRGRDRRRRRAPRRDCGGSSPGCPRGRRRRSRAARARSSRFSPHSHKPQSN